MSSLLGTELLDASRMDRQSGRILRLTSQMGFRKASPLDGLLVTRAAKGDSKAFDRLMRHHSRDEKAMWIAVVALARNHHQCAYALIYQHHRSLVWSCAGKTLRANSNAGEFDLKTEAEDAVQRTFCKAFADLSKYDGRAKLGTWLWTICRNDCIDWLRRKREKPYETIPRLPIEKMEAEVIEAMIDVTRALSQLCDVEREAFKLVIFDGFSQTEAATIVGEIRTTFCSRLKRAKEHVWAACREPSVRELRARAGGAGAEDAELCSLHRSPSKNAMVETREHLA